MKLSTDGLFESFFDNISEYATESQKQLDNEHANYEGNIGAIAGDIVGGIAGAVASGGDPLSTYQAVKAGGAIGQGIDKGIETVGYCAKTVLNTAVKFSVAAYKYNKWTS